MGIGEHFNVVLVCGYWGNVKCELINEEVVIEGWGSKINLRGEIRHE
jgi:hypothetical protein